LGLPFESPEDTLRSKLIPTLVYKVQKFRKEKKRLLMSMKAKLRPGYTSSPR